jgi:hypothetical protein
LIDKVSGFLWRELKLVLPPTIYFFCAFNLIATTSDLLTRHYWFAMPNFLLATGLALVVGKVMLLTGNFTFLDRYRNAPLIWPILFKSLFYTVVVGLVRLLEIFIHIARDERGVQIAFHAQQDAFSWQHFAMIQTWLFVCFAVYVLAIELAKLTGKGSLMALLFHHREPTAGEQR